MIPNFYRPPLNLPLNWRDEVSGVLPAAVEAYLDNRIEGTTITDAQITVLREYIVHYINAPCWDNPEFVTELAHLRTVAPGLDTATDIAEFIRLAMDIGLDPL